MARGNHVDCVEVTERFGLIILHTFFKHQSFLVYREIKLSKKGLVMGLWMNYKDYLKRIDPKAKLLRVTKGYLFFKL